MRLQVLIDGIVFENKHQLGIWRVFYETIARLKSRVDFIILLERETVNPLPGGVKTLKSNHRRVERGRWRFTGAIKQDRSIRRLERQFPDAIWHSSYFTPDPRRRGCSIVHVFDMIAEQFYFYSSALEDQCSLKLTAISGADRALSISETTTIELVRFFPAMRNNIFTAPLGSEHISCGDSPKPIRTKTCLYVGHRNSYKNFQLIVRALALPQWPTEMKLSVVGHPFTENEIAYIKYYDVESMISHLGRLSDRELSQQYRRSHCFICPSLDEGFGLPVLESQAHGCIPVLSDIPIFHEVSGGIAAFFNPYDPVSLATQIALTNSLQSQISRSKCEQNAARFSWEKTAEVTYDCYLDLAQAIAD